MHWMHHPYGGNNESTDCARMPWERAVIAAKACALAKQGRKQPIEQEASGYVQENATGPADMGGLAASKACFQTLGVTLPVND